MLGIVLANNFLQMFIFWELVGVSSYLLIGFWFETAGGGGRGQEGVHHQPPRRLRLPARHPDGLGGLRLAELRRDREELWRQPAGAGRAGHDRRPADLLRRDGQVRAVPAARLAAGRHGRPDAGQRADPCRDDGGRGRLHALPGVLPARHPGRALDGHRVDRRVHRPAGRAHRRPAERHQAHPGLLDALAARLHGHGGRPAAARRRRCST